MNSNIKVKKTISEVKEVENINGNISAQVTISDGIVSSISSGAVKKSGNIIATFNCYSPQNLSISYNTADIDRCTVLTDVEAFINDVNEKGGEA